MKTLALLLAFMLVLPGCGSKALTGDPNRDPIGGGVYATTDHKRGVICYTRPRAGFVFDSEELK